MNSFKSRVKLKLTKVAEAEAQSQKGETYKQFCRWFVADSRI